MPSFDWMAKPYALFERVLFGSTFHATRTALIPELAGARRVLVLGEGDGRFVATLLAYDPHVEVVVVDGSREMLRVTRARCADYPGRAEFVHANVVTWLATQERTAPFDGVVTTFFLDCLTQSELATLFTQLDSHVTPDVRWLWADLVVPTHGFRRLLARALLRALYAVFALTTNITARRLVSPDPYFRSHRWRAAHVKPGLLGIWQARLFVRS